MSTHRYEQLLSELPPTLPDPDKNVVNNGTPVFRSSLRSRHAEAWVREIRRVVATTDTNPDTRIDWYYRSGCMHVDAIGDIRAVRAAILQTRPMHDYFYVKEIRDLGSPPLFNNREIAWQLYALWDGYHETPPPPHI